MSCKHGGRWSAPVFMEMAKGSAGFQIGASSTDLVLVVTNQSGVDKLLRNKVTLGGDASIAAGPIGRSASAATDAQLSTEMLAYSRSKGLFAGIDVSGGVLRPDDDANTGVYGSRATPSTILATREMSAPPEAASFLSALKSTAAGSVARPSASAAAPAPPRPAPATATDEDIRARIVDIQQSVDRMLADTTPAAVGTSGTSGSEKTAGTVNIDRARLMQVRQQLDALLATLNRR
jgi:hypothetical protein